MTQTLDPPLGWHSLLTRVPGRDLWECEGCKALATWAELRTLQCAPVEPCEHCGGAPECSPTCEGMATELAELARRGAHIVGSNK